MTMRKRSKIKKFYKRLPKGTTSNWEWRGNAFVEVFTIHGHRYVKHYTPNTLDAKSTITSNTKYHR